jgi:SLAP domain-containing protein
MQKLLYEEAWDKTISADDRALIKEIFHEAVLDDIKLIQFTPLWQAVNHKGELLITVIIHNVSKNAFSIINQSVYYKAGEETIAKHEFTLPLTVKGKTSMPWTFIFPARSIIVKPLPENGYLELEKSYDLSS